MGQPTRRTLCLILLIPLSGFSVASLPSLLTVIVLIFNSKGVPYTVLGVLPSVARTKGTAGILGTLGDLCFLELFIEVIS
jgi:hypothetical protein